MGYIYIIRTTESHKVYIGQTRSTIKSRWNKHKYGAVSYANYKANPVEFLKTHTWKGTCSHLYAAFNKYGINTFHMNVILEAPDEELNDIEVAYISLYNSVENGYNLKFGGDSSPHSESTRKVISECAKKYQQNNHKNYRKHDDKLADLPMRCIYLKSRNAYAINKHPLCSHKSFSAKKYGTLENAKKALLEYHTALENKLKNQTKESPETKH